MKATIVVTLERPAKKGGGDRYMAALPYATLDDATQLPIGEGFQVYIPQQISRTSGKPSSMLTLTISNEKGEVA